MHLFFPDPEPATINILYDGHEFRANLDYVLLCMSSFVK